MWILLDGENVSYLEFCTYLALNLQQKGMPDALSKTIPVWCCVLNRAFFPNDPAAHQLYAPPQVVSKSEHAQMTNLIPQFVQAFQTLNLSIETFRNKIRKPIRPIWVTPDSQISDTSKIFEDFHPVVCCTVSRRVSGGEVSEGGYIQGAGDDTENWAYGLTPKIFWANKQKLLETPEEDLPELIGVLICQLDSSLGSSDKLRLAKPTNCLSISTIDALPSPDSSPGTCTIVLLPKVTPKQTWYTSSSRIDVGLGSKKVGSKNLRAGLKNISEFFIKSVNRYTLKGDSSKPMQIIVACESGQDLSLGVALALLCLHFDDDGNLKVANEGDNPSINKDFIRRRLTWISTSMPDANPSRATLQSVNSFLMSP